MTSLAATIDDHPLGSDWLSDVSMALGSSSASTGRSLPTGSAVAAAAGFPASLGSAFAGPSGSNSGVSGSAGSSLSLASPMAGASSTLTPGTASLLASGKGSSSSSSPQALGVSN